MTNKDHYCKYFIKCPLDLLLYEQMYQYPGEIEIGVM